jgi:hypothetical protein
MRLHTDARPRTALHQASTRGLQWNGRRFIEPLVRGNEAVQSRTWQTGGKRGGDMTTGHLTERDR